ncbi:MAG TPA: ParA family protein [Kofleriaceae bacterium]|nr:ParA family protein [Kofleriaceae bacterium]
MAHIVAVVNQKGGVGKTTTAVNLAASVAAGGHRVLLCDFDPQGNASSAVGYPRSRVELSIYDAMIGEVAPSDCVRPTEITTLSVIPATTDLVGAELELAAAERRERFLSDALDQVAGRFDYVFVDCPPSLGLLTLNALCAAHTVLVPMQAEYFSLEGLSSLLDTINRVRDTYNAPLALGGVLFCMYDPRTNLAGQVRSEVESHLGSAVYQTSIPRNIRLSESPSHGKPVLLYDYRCSGAKSYLDLAREFIGRFPPAPCAQPQTEHAA